MKIERRAWSVPTNTLASFRPLALSVVKLITLSTLLIAMLLPSSFAKSPHKTAPVGLPSSSEPADIVADLYQSRTARLRDLAIDFSRQVESLNRSGKISTSAWTRFRRDILALRDAWKDVEFLAEHLDPGTSSRLNPPPLPRVFMDLPATLTVSNPEGLQVLLEGVYAKVPPSLDSLRGLAQRLTQAAQELSEQAQRFSPEKGGEALEDRMVFEAMKAQVVRVMTLGISGFDSPETERALPESRRALAAMKAAIQPYQPELKKRDARGAARLDRSLEHALALLPEERTFQSFDRLSFLRNAGNPLLAALADAQDALGIATLADLGPLFQSPFDPRTRNLFVPDFLDAQYHARGLGERADAKKIELGRRLFFDPILSGTGAQSCATCHHPEKAFSDGLSRSAAFFVGAPPAQTNHLRNTPGLSHVAYQSAQFWDMRAETLERQIHHVVNGPTEFGTDFLTVLARLRAHREYPERFHIAFPTGSDIRNQDTAQNSIVVGTVTKALAQYMRSLARWNSPFDRYVRGESDKLDPAAKRGFNLFAGKAQCATCHFAPAFNGTIPPRYLESESEVLGVPVTFPPLPGERLALDPDPGRLPIHHAAPFLNSFKTPSLRNIALTAPYMHNGGMQTLEDVMVFYNAGGGEGVGLRVPHQTLPSDSLGLTRQEMDDVVAFMKSLTDTTGYGKESVVGSR